MKKKVFGMVCVAAMLLAGCGSSEKVITNDAVNSTVENRANAQTGTTLQKTQEGYVFEAKGVTLAIEAEAEPLIAALGDALSYYEAPSCAFGDLDKIYTYSGFELDTYQMEKKDYVSAVLLKDDSVSTPEGVSIGDAAEQVKKVYGEPSEEKDTAYTYKKGNMKLLFMLSDGKVSQIQYLNTILD